MFSEYLIRSWEFLGGLATAIVSEAGLTSGFFTFNLSLGFFAGGWPAGGVVDSATGMAAAGVAEGLFGRAGLERPPDMPRSVASLYFLILALEIREVK